MTNGWSNYFWNAINEDSVGRLYEPELGLTFKGQVKRVFGKKAPSGASITMMLQKSDGKSMFYDQPVDSTGNFEFRNVVFVDSAKVVAQARNKRKRHNLSFTMELQKQDPPGITEFTLQTLQYYSEIPYSIYRQRYQESMKLKQYYPDNDIIQIDEVEVKGWHYNPKIKTGVVRKNDGPYKLTWEETQKDYMDIITYLAYEVPGIYSSIDSRGNMVVSVGLGWGPAAIALGGLRIITQDEARNIPIGMLETIEIRTPPMSYYLGSKALSGAIILTTVTEAPIVPQRPILGGIVERINGFTPLREFYSPKYTQENINSEIPDPCCCNKPSSI